MIVKMMKYNIVLLAAEREGFIERLRELGMVDITTAGWEPAEKDRQLITDLEGRRKALDTLEQFAASEEYKAEAGKPLAKGEAYAAYTAVQGDLAATKAELARLEKLTEEWEPWGEFDVEQAKRLAEAGITLRYFITPQSTFDKHSAEWGEQFSLSLISTENSMARFVAITMGEDIMLDAQELKAPTLSPSDIHKAIDEAAAKIEQCNLRLSLCADARHEIAAELAALKEQLQDVRIEATAERAADNMLLVMEGWAEEANTAAVEATLNEQPNLVYMVEQPREEDDTPVKLKNNRFARLFELIGGMYALPKYGTLDLTPFFGPFYMLFFAICLNDAGYGAILLAAGLWLYFKGSEKLRRAALLTIVCGSATTLFGIYTGSIFGASIPSMIGYQMKDGATFPFLDFQGKFFYIALCIGIIQILFGMMINIVMKIKHFGLLSACPLMGWFILLVSAIAFAALPMSNVVFYAMAGVGLVLMLFFNSRNPIKSILSGTWDTYNNVTGLLSDVLSYIRLFAIGLSGGVLAQVFNSLALGLTGLEGGIKDFGVGTIFQILAATAILLVGHGINLFMSAISSFVHPMRLTFVEFYKNAGFEMTTRGFDPIKKENI